MDKRILSMLLALCMLFTVLPSSALAEANTPVGTETEIIAFAALAETEKTVPLGMPEADLELPENLMATVITTITTDSGTQDSGTQDSGVTSKEEDTLVPVTWICEAGYNMDTAGVYTFRPVINGYTISAVLPEITVTVGESAALMMPRTAGDPTEVNNLSELQTKIDNATGDLDLKLSDKYTYSEGKLTIINNYNFTLDLNGKTLDGGDNAAIEINCNGTLTIIDSGTDGTVTADNPSSGSGTIYIEKGNLEITGGTISAVYCAIYNNGDGAVNISGGTVSSTKSKAIYNKLTGTVSLTGGLISSSEDIAIYTNYEYNGKILIPSGNPLILGAIQAMNKAPDLSGYDDGNIYGSTTSTNGTGVAGITKSDIDTDAEVRNYKSLSFWQGTSLETYTITYDANGGSGSMANGTAWRGAAFTLPGGWVFSAPSGMRFKAWAIGSPSGVLVYEWDSHMFMADTTVYAVWDDAFAEINGTEYLTLQQAVNAVKEGETIKLLSDISLVNQLTVTIPSGKPSFTLDLNGKTLDGKTQTAIINNSSGTLTITDSSPGATGKITSTKSNTLVNCGNVVVSGGTVENAAGGTAIYLSGLGSVIVSGGMVNVIGGGTAIDNLYNASGSVTISGGTVSANGRYGKAIRNTQGSVNITGGLISADLTAIHNENAGKITISGNAKITSTNGFPQSGTIFLNEGTADKTVLEITGGLVENTVWSNAIYNNANGKIVIPSGTPIITGKIQAINKAPDLSGYADVKIMASTTDASGMDAAVIAREAIDTDEEVQAYKYLSFGEISAPATYTITYDANGGSGSMANGSAEQGKAFTLPDNGFSAPEGRRFKAWAIGSTSGSQVIAEATHCFTADTTVYAVWEDIPTVIVAEINGRGYDTLQKAFDAVTDGQTIKLLSDITLKNTVEIALGKPSFTLDLNGKTVDGGTAIVISHRGRCTLTIADSSTGGKITSALPMSIAGTIRVDTGNGNLIVAGGTVENTGTHGRGAIYNERAGYVSILGGTVRSSNTGILNDSTGSVTVSGGTVSADGQGAIYNSFTGRVTISGGTVSAGYTPAIYNQNTGKITISGDAKVTSTVNSSNVGTIVLYKGTADNTILEITGGTVENTSVGWSRAIYNFGNGKIVIPSGTPVIKAGNIAMNKAPDLSGYDDPKITASKTDPNGTDAVSITKNDIDTDAKVQTYKYLNFGQIIAPTTYTITYDANGGSGTMANGTASQDTAFTLPANGFNPPSGKRFKAWAIGSAAGSLVNAGGGHTFAANTTVYAVWENISSTTYTITYNANGGSGTMANDTVTQDTAFTLPASSFTAPSGKRFKAWAIGSTTGSLVNAGESHTFTANTTVYAVWENIPTATYTITYNANGGSVSPASATTNGEYKLTALPTPTRSGYTFSGWYTAASGGTAVTTGTVFNANTTIYARWTASSSVSISGVVKNHENNPVQYATVKLQQGVIEIASTLTDTEGHYEILNVKPGIYNIVVNFEGKTYTLDTIMVINQNIIINPQLPDINRNTVLQITGSATPNVTVDGLVTVSLNKDADITMHVEKKPEEAADNANSIRILASGKTLEYLDISLKAGNSPLHSTGNVLQIIIPFDFTNKQNISVYRYHNNAQAFIEADTELDGTFKLDRINNVIRVYASQFSTYAIGYAIKTGGGGSSSSNNDVLDSNEFWDEVMPAVNKASEGDVVKVDAESFDKMPWDVMQKLYDNKVGMLIEWTNGKEINIPAGKAVNPKTEAGRMYYPLSYLEKLFAGKQIETNYSNANSNINPKTGGEIQSADNIASTKSLNEAIKESTDAGIVKNSNEMLLSASPETANTKPQCKNTIVPILLAILFFIVLGLGYWYYKKRNTVQ